MSWGEITDRAGWSLGPHRTSVRSLAAAVSAALEFILNAASAPNRARSGGKAGEEMTTREPRKFLEWFCPATERKTLTDLRYFSPSWGPMPSNSRNLLSFCHFYPTTS